MGAGQKSKPSNEAMERLTELDLIEILEDSLTRVGIEQWLRASNRMLGRRSPKEAIQEDDLDEVKRAAQAFVDGVLRLTGASRIPTRAAQVAHRDRGRDDDDRGRFAMTARRYPTYIITPMRRPLEPRRYRG